MNFVWVQKENYYYLCRLFSDGIVDLDHPYGYIIEDQNQDKPFGVVILQGEYRPFTEYQNLKTAMKSFNKQIVYI